MGWTNTVGPHDARRELETSSSTPTIREERPSVRQGRPSETFTSQGNTGGAMGLTVQMGYVVGFALVGALLA